MIYKTASAVSSFRPNSMTTIIHKLTIMVLCLFFLSVFCGAASLNAAPSSVDKSAQETKRVQKLAKKRERLFAALKAAPDENTGRKIEFQIWELWLRDADVTSRTLVMDAMSMRADYIEHSLKLLDTAIKLKPDYAEAYNQRSFVYFLKNDLERSLLDSEKALELEPNHFGALSGQAQIFLRQGRRILMQKVLRRAVKIHPWLKERHMLPGDESETKEPVGQEL